MCCQQSPFQWVVVLQLVQKVQLHWELGLFLPFQSQMWWLQSLLKDDCVHESASEHVLDMLRSTLTCSISSPFFSAFSTSSEYHLINCTCCRAITTLEACFKGLDDKREITVLLTISADGTLLPPQVIYQGKTNRCHADVTFPDDWNITHSESYWSTAETMMEYADKILIPYCDKKKEQLKVKQSQKSLAIFWRFCSTHSWNIPGQAWGQQHPCCICSCWMHWWFAATRCNRQWWHRFVLPW